MSPIPTCKSFAWDRIKGCSKKNSRNQEWGDKFHSWFLENNVPRRPIDDLRYLSIRRLSDECE